VEKLPDDAKFCTKCGTPVTAEAKPESTAVKRFEKEFIRNISKIHEVLLLLDVIGGLITSKDLHQKYSDRIANTTVA
jgi:uncharacterized membrane protein YvbJ